MDTMQYLSLEAGSAPPSRPEMESALSSLQKTLNDYKQHKRLIAELYSDTEECFNELKTKLDLSEELNVPSIPQNTQMPSVMFIGNHNCGKSTLLNVILKGSHLPTHENPCTSRIVRTVHSDHNYARLVDEHGIIIKECSFKKKIPAKFVVLEDAAKDDHANLKAIVEVGLNHELLRSGIELIDSPGRCESDALDRIVEGFLQKGMIPLVVYVIDGNQQIGQKDKETIRELQDKFPSISLMFVCSKVDMSEETKAYDHDSDEEDGESEASQNEMTRLAQEKKTAVFRKLVHLGFLPQDLDEMGRCAAFHGISALRVRKALKSKHVNDATESFDRLLLCILEKLEDALKRQCNRELASLLSTQEMVLSLTASTRKVLNVTKDILSAVCQQALKTELSLFQAVMQLCAKADAITATICQEMDSLTWQFLKQAEDYKGDGKTLRKVSDSVKLEAGLNPLQIRQIQLEELLVMDFLGDMKGAILDKTFNAMKTSLNAFLRDTISTAIGQLIKLSQSMNHPFIGRLLQRTYEIDLLKSQCSQLDSESNLQMLYEVLDGLFETVNAAVSKTLRREISLPLSKFDVRQVGRSARPRDPLWRRKVVQTLLSKLDYSSISTSVIKTCEETLIDMHRLFRNTVESFRQLNDAMESIKVPSQVDELRRVYVPRIAELANRGHALRYLVNRGPVELGDLITRTAHSALYKCSSPLWFGAGAGAEQSVVKVISKDDVGEEVWKQTMLDNMHTKDIFDKLGDCPANHLRLIGWVMPKPGVMYMAMERAKSDLLVALQEGYSWQQKMGVAMDVAKGLEKIHHVEYVYQDLKPQNVMISPDGTAKINLCKPEKPFEMTNLGLPFHISPDMYRRYGQGQSNTKFDIYAFGSLLWVLCEGSGTKSPRAFEHCHDNEAIQTATRGGVRPERPEDATDTCWDLMNKCWAASVSIKDVIEKLTDIIMHKVGTI